MITSNLPMSLMVVAENTVTLGRQAQNLMSCIGIYNLDAQTYMGSGKAKVRRNDSNKHKLKFHAPSKLLPYVQISSPIQRLINDPAHTASTTIIILQFYMYHIFIEIFIQVNHIKPSDEETTGLKIMLWRFIHLNIVEIERMLMRGLQTMTSNIAAVPRRSKTCINIKQNRVAS